MTNRPRDAERYHELFQFLIHFRQSFGNAFCQDNSLTRKGWQRRCACLRDRVVEQPKILSGRRDDFKERLKRRMNDFG